MPTGDRRPLGQRKRGGQAVVDIPEHCRRVFRRHQQRRQGDVGQLVVGEVPGVFAQIQSASADLREHSRTGLGKQLLEFARELLPDLRPNAELKTAADASAGSGADTSRTSRRTLRL